MNNTTTPAEKIETTVGCKTRQWTVVRELPASTPEAAERLRAMIGCVRQAAVESAKGRSGLMQVFEDGTIRVVCMNATTEYVRRYR